jgi:CheY-like chemotaxis protein
VKFDVKDTGIGIAANRLNSIFESYIQGAGDISRNFGGTGLGLTITKQLIDLQKGEIYVKSKPDVGSEFVFVLTFRRSDKKLNDESHTIRNEKPNLKGLNFMVVEDNKINQFVIKQILEKCGATVTLAENGQLCIDLLKENDIFCIFMDLQMPVMDGFEATRIIRSSAGNVHLQNIPVIALTADALIETRKKVLQSGFNDFLTKPFKEYELFQMINKYLKQS